MLGTERSDYFCAGLMNGRVGLLMDGLPIGYLLPGGYRAVSQGASGQVQQLRDSQSADADPLYLYGGDAAAARLLCGGGRVPSGDDPDKAGAVHHLQQTGRPFSTVFEVMAMLVAFEILQEAGLRLPKTIGQTVSIIGGLVVGQSAVEAKIVSPVVVIVVAVAGITGYTMPNQDFANALRVWRFSSAAAGVAGLFGMMVASVALVYRLAAIESLRSPI